MQGQTPFDITKGYATYEWATPRKNDITGIVWLAMLGSLYEISDEDMKDEKETKSMEEGQVSLHPPLVILW